MGAETAGLVLAAGAGRRYGMPKALIPYPQRLLVQLAADTLYALRRITLSLCGR